MNKKYDPSIAEPAAQQLWEQAHTYKAENNPGQLYSIDTPPPTVSGALHIGHIFSYTQTDIMARAKRMEGFSVFYPFGFDDNGLPTERFVEKKTGRAAHSMSRSEFIALCLHETGAVEEQFKALWQKMGLSVDWDLSYSTIEEKVRALSQKSFIELYKKNYVYRKEEPALYCVTCQTSVAQAELDDQEVGTLFYTLAFTTTAGQKLPIATTRPELLPSCVALMYNPDDMRYSHLKDQEAVVPFYGTTVPCIADSRVKIDKGTGLVMCCPFGDTTDIEWYKQYKLPYKPSFGRDGRWLEHTGPLAGLKAVAARQKMIEVLKNLDLVIEEKAIMHAVNIHERCKTPIEFLLLSQWFLKILEFKQNFIELGNKINWYPTFMKSRYQNWVENIKWDWCISRQRFFGIPFPVWHCLDCHTVILAQENELPIDPQEKPLARACTQCGGKNFVPDTDVMDTWNTSSLTPYICKEMAHKKADFIPMGMRPQAHDIIRTWAFYTIIKSWMHDQTIPWHDIVISGHVLSSEHEKISKSQGNSPLLPENLLKRYPADAIRYWSASGTLGHDTAFSETQLVIGQKLLVKLWNACAFIAEHTKEHDTSDAYANQRDVANRWIMDALAKTYTKYQDYFNRYDLSLALDTVDMFFWQDFCDNYLELIKDQLFNPDRYEPGVVAATRATLAYCGIRILQLYAPFIPHITETIYQELYKERYKAGSLHQLRHSVTHQALDDAFAVAAVNELLAVVQIVRKLKGEGRHSLKTELNQLIIICSEAQQAHLMHTDKILKGVTRAHEIVYAHDGGDTRLESSNGLVAYVNLRA